MIILGYVSVNWLCCVPAVLLCVAHVKASIHYHSSVLDQLLLQTQKVAIRMTC